MKSILLVATFLLAAQASFGAETQPARWSIGLRGGYDTINYKDLENRGTAWASIRYRVSPSVRLVTETGFSRYVSPNSFESRLTVVPIGVGIRIEDSDARLNRPFLQILPTVFHGHSETTGSYEEGTTHFVNTGWTTGLQMDLGFHLNPRRALGWDLGLRYLWTLDTTEYRIGVPDFYQGSRVTRHSFELRGLHNLVVYAGVNLGL